MIARFKDKPLDFEPGSKFHYSNSGYFLLGAIIEKVSGKTYEAFLKEAIFEPLGMKDTGYDHHRDGPAEAGLGLRPQGRRAGQRRLPGHEPALRRRARSTRPSGDLLKWDRASKAGKLALEGARWPAMFTPFKNDYAYGWVDRRPQGPQGGRPRRRDQRLRHRHPALPRRRRLRGRPLQRRCPSNPGKVAHDLAAIVFGETVAAAQSPRGGQGRPEGLRRLRRAATARPDVRLTITREGDRLITQATGQAKIEIFPESETDLLPQGRRRPDHVREGGRQGHAPDPPPGRPGHEGEARAE